MSAIHDKEVSQQKKDIVAALKEEMQSAKGAVFTTYKGLTVAQDTQLRRALREAGVSYHVIKNTLTTIAAKELGLDELVPHLNGTTALASSKEDAVAPAKVISEFIKNVAYCSFFIHIGMLHIIFVFIVFRIIFIVLRIIFIFIILRIIFI